MTSEIYLALFALFIQQSSSSGKLRTYQFQVLFCITR